LDPIVVPAPPKSSFNKNRRVSDLLLAQVRHFQHVAHKQGIEVDPALERDVASEAGVARYVARVTREIRNRAQAKPSVIATPAPRAAAPARQPAIIQQMAASAETSDTPPSNPSRKKSKKGSKKSS
jgi:hypothetical protein